MIDNHITLLDNLEKASFTFFFMPPGFASEGYYLLLRSLNPDDKEMIPDLL